MAKRWLRQVQLTPGEAPVCAQPLLIPLRLKVSGEEKSALEKAQSALAELGIDFQSDAQHVTMRAVPLPLRQQNLQILIPELIGYLAKQSVLEPGNIAQWIARNLMSEHAQWSMAQAITLLADVERLCPQLVKTPPGGLLQSVDLHPAIKALKMSDISKASLPKAIFLMGPTASGKTALAIELRKILPVSDVDKR